MKLTGAIFDADGTLLDSMGIWKNLGVRYLAGRGIKAEKGLSKILYPMSMAESCVYLKTRYDIQDSVDSIHEDLLALLRDFYLKKVGLKPGVKTFLEKLKAGKIPMMIATSNDSALLKTCFERLGIDHFFRDILSCKDLGISKTQTEFYLKAAARLESHPETIIVFEDALFAIEAAKKTGMLTVALEDDSNLQERSELESAATLMMRDFTDTVLFEDNFLAYTKGEKESR